MATPTIAMIPSGYKANKVYSVLPTNGDADLTFARTSTSTRVNSNGLIEEIAIGVPSIDYTGGGCPHLSLNPASTNLVEESEDLSSAVLSNCTVTSGFTSPKGGLEAYKLVEDSANTTKILQVINNTNILAGTVTTASIYVKAGERTKVRVWGYHLSNQYFLVDYDLTDNSYITSGGDNTVLTGYNIEDVGNDWKRISVTGYKSASSYSWDVAVSPLDDSGNVTYLGDGSSGLYVFGGQVEEQSYATSYIPTSGATATRAAETLSKTGLSSYINSVEGVLYLEVAGFSDTNTSNREISLSDNSTNNVAKIVLSNTGAIQGVFRTNESGSVVESCTITYSPPFEITDFTKIAFKYKQNDFALWVNGVEAGTDTSGETSLTGVLNTIRNDRGNAVNMFYGKVKDLRVFNTALTDAELLTLTT